MNTEDKTIIIVDDYILFKSLITSHPCVVKFTAKWCQPCKIIHPFYLELAKLYKEILFLEIDIDNEEIMNTVNVKALPTFQFYFKGECKYQFASADQENLKINVHNLNLLIHDTTDLNIVKSPDLDPKHQNLITGTFSSDDEL